MKETKEMFCNVCGRKIRIEDGILKEDVLEVKKVWGYFSKKDMQLHAFNVCESCYDTMISKFAILPEISEVTEL